MMKKKTKKKTKKKRKTKRKRKTRMKMKIKKKTKRKMMMRTKRTPERFRHTWCTSSFCSKTALACLFRTRCLWWKSGGRMVVGGGRVVGGGVVVGVAILEHPQDL